MIDANVIAHGSTWFSNDKVTFRYFLADVFCNSSRCLIISGRDYKSTENKTISIRSFCSIDLTL